MLAYEGLVRDSFTMILVPSSALEILARISVLKAYVLRIDDKVGFLDIGLTASDL